MSSNCVENSFFRVSPSGRNEKTPFASNSTRSASYHHFGWAFPSSAKRRVDEGRPIAFKTRFFDYPHRGKTKKTPLGSNSTRSVSYHHFGVDLPSAENAGLTKVVQLRSKLVFLRFPIGAKRKNTLGIEFHEFGFKPQFWLLQAAQKASCVVHRVQCTVSSAQSTASVPCIVHSAESTVYRVLCTEYSLPCMVHSAQSTVYRV